MKLDDFFVSVIIPNYNHEKYLKQRIESVLNQTFQNFEIILLDDMSTDNSIDILNLYKDHPKVSHLVVNKANSGSPFKQWFKGIDKAKGKYIWIAESDDYSSPLFLSKAIKEFNKSYCPDIVFTGTTNVDENGIEIKNKTRIERKYEGLLSNNFEIKGREFLKKFMPNYCVIRNASSTVFKKEIISPKSIKAVNYRVIGDFYFWVNFCLENRSFSYVCDNLNFMRNHTSTVRRNNELIVKKQEEFNRVYKEVWLRNKLNFKVMKILLTFLFRR